MAKEVDDFINAIELTPEQRALALSNPLLFSDIWREMQQAVMINDWPIIIAAISLKAAKGDTSAAKFITDFIEPLAKADRTPKDSIEIEWEEKAIKLRDYLGVEMSALMLVEVLLDKLMTMPKESTLQLLLVIES